MQSSREILRHSQELNPGQRENRQWNHSFSHRIIMNDSPKLLTFNPMLWEYLPVNRDPRDLQNTDFEHEAGFSADASRALHRSPFMFIGDARVMPGIQKRQPLADLVKIEEKKINDKWRLTAFRLSYMTVWRQSNVLIISANVVNNHQESLYQPREAIWITHYAVYLIVDSLPFTTSTATAFLPWGAKMRFD